MHGVQHLNVQMLNTNLIGCQQLLDKIHCQVLGNAKTKKHTYDIRLTLRDNFATISDTCLRP